MKMSETVDCEIFSNSEGMWVSENSEIEQKLPHYKHP